MIRNKSVLLALFILSSHFSQRVDAKTPATLCAHVLVGEVGTLAKVDAANNRTYYLLGAGGYAHVYRTVDRATGQTLGVVKVYDKSDVEKEGSEGLFYDGFKAADVARADAENLEFLAKVTAGRKDTFRVAKLLKANSDEQAPGAENKAAPSIELEFIEGQNLKAIIEDKTIALSVRTKLLRKYNRYLNRLNDLLTKNYAPLIFDSHFANNESDKDKVGDAFRTSLFVEFYDDGTSSLPGVNGLGIVISNILVTPNLDFYIIDPY